MKNSVLNKTKNKQAGMTYVELIVVLSIFAIMLSIALFNYKKFQGKVDIKNLASDVALKLVESQKSALNGKYTAGGIPNWKPAYGVYFNPGISTTKFLYFADLNNSSLCDTGTNCTSYTLGGEVQDVINITRGNSLSNLQVSGVGGGCPATIANLTVVFKRPSSTPTISTTTSLAGCSVSYYAINIASNPATQTVTAQIRLYPSGRIQIN